MTSSSSTLTMAGISTALPASGLHTIGRLLPPKKTHDEFPAPHDLTLSAQRTRDLACCNCQPQGPPPPFLVTPLRQPLLQPLHPMQRCPLRAFTLRLRHKCGIKTWGQNVFPNRRIRTGRPLNALGRCLRLTAARRPGVVDWELHLIHLWRDFGTFFSSSAHFPDFWKRPRTRKL